MGTLVALLVLNGQIACYMDGAPSVGKLSLDGSVHHVNGMLPLAHHACEAGYKSLFVPQVDAPEAALVEGIDVYPVDTLAHLVAHFRDYNPIQPYRAHLSFQTELPNYATDFSDVKG